jgi:hypothetical protein
MHASVTVTGPHRFRARLTKTATLGLSPGVYATAAARVNSGIDGYVPIVRPRSINVVGGKRRLVAVMYTHFARPTGATPGTTSGNAGGGTTNSPPTSAGGGTGGGASAGGGNTASGAGAGGGGAAGGGGVGAAGAGGSPTGAVKLYLAYADLFRPPANGLPSPWSGSPDVTFVGCGSTEIDNPGAPCDHTAAGKEDYDAGAIRLDNNSTVPVTITNVSVQISTCTYAPWRGMKVTIQPGDKLILTQTGGSNPCGKNIGPDNFDTSDSNGACTSTEVIPVITLTIDGATFAVADSDQILNSGGADKGVCTGTPNEFHDWVAVT